ncbi:cytochrome ubiquinol oxidase subunit I [Pseudonocardia phyllosphaerae]|uniref:cytochrome ubiquinol oxidase subunit I n=1 Tax=Pseudonocardia phyllosphaerae TaxID=3390502 RepID=UPI003978CECB
MTLAGDTLARWQFGLTTVYHYFFVPLTIGLAAITAGLETAWVRTNRDKYFHATKFWGKLFLVNIAIGVVTGIVQEFQFGLNWSAYSKFVGDVFGAPLAMEALLAFFFESTFIGLWIFGWDKLPKAVHCACMWIVSIGTILSSYFILAANSWMQHPVGYKVDPATGKAQLTDIAAVLFQETTVVVVFHTLAAAALSAGALVVGISALHLLRTSRLQRKNKETNPKSVATMRTSLRVGLIVSAVGGLVTALSGDSLGKVMFVQQPMKMAAAEALWETEGPAPFSIFAIGDVRTGHNVVDFQLPGLLSFLAHSDFTSPVPGINDTAAAEAAAYGGTPAEYLPAVIVAYWGFRIMIGVGMTSFGVAMAGLYLTRNKLWVAKRFRTREDQAPRLMVTNKIELPFWISQWVWRGALLTLAFPLIANSAGWIFTEMGRQPWVVFGLMRTSDAVSPGVTVAEQAITVIGFAVLYVILAVIEVRLLARFANAGPDTTELPPGVQSATDDPEAARTTPAFAY